MARSSSSRADDHDRLRLLATPSPRTSGAEKKESTDLRLSQDCQRCATPSSISYFDRHLSDAHTAEDEAVKSRSNKSAKVVLERVPINWSLQLQTAVSASPLPAQKWPPRRLQLRHIAPDSVLRDFAPTARCLPCVCCFKPIPDLTEPPISATKCGDQHQLIAANCKETLQNHELQNLTNHKRS